MNENVKKAADSLKKSTAYGQALHLSIHISQTTSEQQEKGHQQTDNAGPQAATAASATAWRATTIVI